MTIVSLREESYYTANVQKTFTAYSNRKFHIASPLFRGLIGNRIRFAIDVLRRADEELQVILASGLELDKTSITRFLQIVQDSIFQHNKNIARFIEAICFGNMRLALQMFATFLVSGATDVDKMLHIYDRDGKYYVAFHEFVRSIMLGDRKYYKEEQSPIMNGFDCGSDRNASHFTAIRILNSLLIRRGENTREGQGYVEIAGLLGGFEDVFDNRADFIRAMNRLVIRQLVEVNTKSTENVEGASHLRVTSAGWYYAKFLTHSFSYLDLVLQDTPINDEAVERDLRTAVSRVDNLADREEEKIARMEIRFDRVATFLDYLGREETRECAEFGLSTRSSTLSLPIVKGIQAAFQNERTRIEKRLRENRERFAEDLVVGTNEDECDEGLYSELGVEDE